MAALVTLHTFAITPKPVHIDPESVEFIEQGANSVNHSVVHLKSGKHVDVNTPLDVTRNMLSAR